MCSKSKHRGSVLHIQTSKLQTHTFWTPKALKPTRQSIQKGHVCEHPIPKRYPTSWPTLQTTIYPNRKTKIEKPLPGYQGFQRLPCYLEIFKYSRASKKHSFVTPGIYKHNQNALYTIENHKRIPLTFHRKPKNKTFYSSFPWGHKTNTTKTQRCSFTFPNRLY